MYIYIHTYLMMFVYHSSIFQLVTTCYNRQPVLDQGKLIRGAHAVDREFRVMKALNQALWERFLWNL